MCCFNAYFALEMTLEQIKYFLVLAEELHFWNASEQLFISQSSLSRQIKSLEDQLGYPLFIRDKRNVVLTDAGKFLKAHWEVKMKDLDRISTQAKKISKGILGRVSMSYPGSIAFNFLPNLLEVLHQHLPDLKVELTEPDDENHEQLLLDYKIDIAFSRDRIQNISIETHKLSSEPVCLVVPKLHWIQQHHIADLAVLKDEKFIISAIHKTTFFSSFLRNLFISHHFEPKTTIESDFGGMILNLVSKGLGISILPISFSSSEFKNVRFITLDNEIDLFMNWRVNEYNLATKKVLALAKELADKREFS